MERGRPAIGIVVALYEPAPAMGTIGVRVRVVTRAVATSSTDDDGYYSFREPVPPGAYELRLESRREDPVMVGSRSPWLARQELVLGANETERRVDVGLL